ncbi:hypothetical protein FVEN_g9627 [Fusarium venenatum]|uniref:RTA1 like protein-domain-containing protein n=1 Tax=Fusarium venenatum TaxID=56646 RepID=UPI001D58FCDE|nr:hypothetical protein FVEN_g9627 [Fusarium venenatum]KAH7002717.1 RTA1 like protein-domain-containing protein [Fusarium venenatum]
MAESADGNDDVAFKLYRYDPSMAAAVIFTILFMAITGLHLYQMLRTKTWFLICFVIGGFMQFIGYIGRAGSAHETPDWSLTPFIIQNLFLLISPALFAASIYMILGRIILATGGENCSPIRRAWLTKIFVIGDVLSFALQGAGGSMMAAGSLELLHNGERVVMIGLVVQVIFFSLFAVAAALFHTRLLQNLSTKALASNIPWERYLCILYIASGLIMVRSVFRLIEYAQGNAGYLISHEVYMYLFDSVLMLLTMALFAWEHPSQLNAKLKGGGTAVKRGIRLYWES